MLRAAVLLNINNDPRGPIRTDDLGARIDLNTVLEECLGEEALLGDWLRQPDNNDVLAPIESAALAYGRALHELITQHAMRVYRATLRSKIRYSRTRERNPSAFQPTAQFNKAVILLNDQFMMKLSEVLADAAAPHAVIRQWNEACLAAQFPDTYKLDQMDRVLAAQLRRAKQKQDNAEIERLEGFTLRYNESRDRLRHQAVRELREVMDIPLPDRYHTPQHDKFIEILGDLADLQEVYLQDLISTSPRPDQE